MGMRTQGNMELSASNIGKSNTREGKWYRFMHPVQNPFFSGNLSKMSTALHFKIPWP